MADQGQLQAGEGKAHGLGKTGRMMEKRCDADHEANDKSGCCAQTVKDKASGAACAGKDKASGAAESPKDTAHEPKGRDGGMLHRTGEQVKCMAQGAADAVKSTLGMGGGTDKETH